MAIFGRNDAVKPVAQAGLAPEREPACGHVRDERVEKRLFLGAQGPVPAVTTEFQQKPRARRDDLAVKLASLGGGAAFEPDAHMVTHKGGADDARGDAGKPFGERGLAVKVQEQAVFASYERG